MEQISNIRGADDANDDFLQRQISWQQVESDCVRVALSELVHLPREQVIKNVLRRGPISAPVHFILYIELNTT